MSEADDAIAETGQTFSGALYVSPFGHHPVRALLEQEELRFRVDERSLSWQRFSVFPELNWADRGENRQEEGYSFFLRDGAADRFLVVANHRNAVDRLLEALDLARHLKSPLIKVRNFVGDIAASPAGYSISVVWARVEGYGSALRTIALFGDDITESGLFRQNSSAIYPYRVTMRDVRLDSNVLSISSRGEISFNLAGPHSLNQVDDALRHLTQRGYLRWEG